MEMAKQPESKPSRAPPASAFRAGRPGDPRRFGWARRRRVSDRSRLL